jgi:hypothetical protein
MEIVYIPKFSHLFTRIYGITGRNTTTWQLPSVNN